VRELDPVNDRFGSKPVVLWSAQDFRFVPKTRHLRVNEYTP